MGAPFYKLQKSARWKPTQQLWLLTVDRPVDRQRSNFRPLGRSVDWLVERQLGNGLAIDRPVDRAISREQQLSGGRPCGRLMHTHEDHQNL